MRNQRRRRRGCAQGEVGQKEATTAGGKGWTRRERFNVNPFFRIPSARSPLRLCLAFFLLSADRNINDGEACIPQGLCLCLRVLKPPFLLHACLPLLADARFLFFLFFFFLVLCFCFRFFFFPSA